MIDLTKLEFKSYKKLPIPIKAAQVGESFEINTLEGTMTGNPGDYLIIGVQGEMYPCKKNIFEETYVCVDTPGSIDILE